MHSDSDTPAGLRVALSTDSELVTHGLAAMLSPYANRIHLVTPGSPADVTLIDPTVVDLDEALPATSAVGWPSTSGTSPPRWSPWRRSTASAAA